MTFFLRHDFGAASRRLLAAELATCAQCGTLRVVEQGKPTRYLQQGKEASEDAPPCLTPPPRRSFRNAAREREKSLESAKRRADELDDIDRGHDQG